jgi:hypothetical protein
MELTIPQTDTGEQVEYTRVRRENHVERTRQNDPVTSGDLEIFTFQLPFRRVTPLGFRIAMPALSKDPKSIRPLSGPVKCLSCKSMDGFFFIDIVC